MSGKLSLAVKGIQDRWLTEQPQYSHFISRFRRHTKFAFEQVEVPFERFNEPGSEATARIQNNTGDMLKGVTLSVDLPPPIPKSENNVSHTIARVPNSNDVLIDGSVATSFIAYQGVEYTFTSTEQFEVASEVNPNDWSSQQVGNQHILTLKIQVNISATYASTVIRPSDQLYHNNIVSLDVKQIRWDTSTPTKMIKYADLIIGGQTIQRITGDYIYMYNQLNHTDNDTTFTLVPTTLHNSYPIINDATIPRYTDFQKYKIQLPFYFNGHPSLAIPTCGLDVHIIEVKVKLKPADELTVEYDISPPAYNKITPITCDMSPRNMSLFCDFVYVTEDEKNFIRTRPIEYVITQTQVAEIRMKAGVSSRAVMINFKHPVKELFFLAKDDETKEHVPIKHVNLKFNNNTVIDADNLMLSAEQPLRNYTNSIDPDNEFGVYSFSMKPDVHYPTGQVNMSRVIHKLLEVELDDGINSTRSHTLHVYATNYNVVRVNGGMAGLKF
tara:strand:+ start:5198 stop:6691 length:1494 start_codon:yes stop_codon:yes gene_type:complete